jgi:hypothetical protein
VRIFRAIAFGLAASACAVASAAAVPRLSDVQGALRANCPRIGKVKRASCQSMAPEEPTEAVCSYSVARGSKVIKDKSIFAVDSKGWRLIDMPSFCPGQK